MDDLKRAQALLKASEHLYPRWKSGCEALVTRWEWGTFARHSVEPCYFEVHKFEPGRRLRGEPSPGSEATGHGFDEIGRLTVTRRLTPLPGQLSEEFVRYHADRVELLDYVAEKKVQRADVYALDVGRVSRISTAAANSNWFVRTFRYDAMGRVAEVEWKGDNGIYGALHDFRDLEYDDDGAVVRVWRRDLDGSKVLDFERQSKLQTFRSTREQLLLETRKAIIRALREQRLDSPAYALALVYCEAQYQNLIPPSVKVGVVRERDRFIEERGHDDAVEWFLWNPAEWAIGSEPLLPEGIKRKADSANQDLWQNERFAAAEKFFRDLAADLREQELPFAKTDDFVCYASDISLGQGIEDVRRQAPKKVLKLLRERRLL